MTCKQLGGACDMVFKGNTFNEIAELSKAHGTHMLKQGDEAHLRAMEAMRDIMAKPSGLSDWMADKKRLFASLPEIDSE
ncbi:DUF1059 domain-containing protein [Marinomonas balearica]|nr:DUF1059 domain-containing protein [Marinomonas balearica]